VSAHTHPIAGGAITGPRDRALSLAAVIAANAGLGLAYGIGYPLTALTFERWGAAPWLTGVAGAAPALAVLVMLPLVPAIARRLGTVPAMTLGCVVAALGFALMPVLDSPTAWIALRMLQGAGVTLPWLVGETWLNTVADDRTRGRVMSLFVVSLFSGFAAGPLAVGRLGTEGWAPFLLAVAALALTATPLVLARRLAPPVEGHGGTGLLAAARLVPLAMAGALAAGLLEMGNLALLPVYALGAGLDEAGGLRLLTALIVGGLVLQFAVGWLSDRLPRRALLVALGLVCATLPAALGLAVARPAGIAVAFLLGGAVLGVYSLSLTILGERVRAADLAAANAAFLVLYQLGAIAGPGLGGLAMGLWQPHGFLALVAAAGLALVAAAARMR
jgi:MFS family permease